MTKHVSGGIIITGRLEMITEKAKERQRLCGEEFRTAKSPQDIDRAYKKYLDAIGGAWPEIMLCLWQKAYGVRDFDSYNRR